MSIKILSDAISVTQGIILIGELLAAMLTLLRRLLKISHTAQHNQKDFTWIHQPPHAMRFFLLALICTAYKKTTLVYASVVAAVMSFLKTKIHARLLRIIS